MHFPRLPDWVIYLAVVAALLVAALGRRQASEAPPPPVVGPEIAEGPLLGPASPFDPSVVVEVPEAPVQAASGTAFSVADSGVWLTARHVVDGCARAALVVGGDRGVQASIRIDPRGEAAVLTTDGGAPALPLGLDQPLRTGERAFHPGFPRGEPGEASSRLIGRETLVVRGRGARREPVLVWAEVSRSTGLEGSLAGLSGAPALDSEGRVIGVTVAESPRRGRIYTTAPETVRAALALEAQRSGRRPAASLAPTALTDRNYDDVADDLRRQLRVAQVICLPA